MERSGFGTIRRGRSGRYQARVRVRGHQIGIGAFDTRREAATAIAAFVASYGTRRVIDRKAGRQSLGTFAESWWETRSGHRPSTRLRDREVLDHDVLPFFGDASLSRVERADVEQWVAELSRRLAPSSLRRSFVILDQLLSAAVARGLIATSPARGVELPRLVIAEARFLSPAELERLADAIDAHYRAMVLVMAFATLRIGEVAGLRRSDVDLDSGSFRVANNAVGVGGVVIEGPPTTKAGRRSMSLPSSVSTELAEHLHHQPGSTYVFGPSGAEPLRASDWRSSTWRRAVIAARLRPLRPHDLKHTGVALLISAGIDPKEISRRAGHASVAFTLDRHGHLLPEVDKQAGAKLEALRSMNVT